MDPTKHLLRSLRETDEVSVPYKPIIRAVRSKSRGYVHRPISVTTGRMMHLQSEGEYHAFHFLDLTTPRLKNLREGFGLPLSLTQQIASDMGVKHPYDRFAKEDAQMSVDFVCTHADGSWSAIDYKPSADIRRKRVRDKLEITRRALAQGGVPHRILTERDLDPTVLRNLLVLRPLTLPQEKIHFSQQQLTQLAGLLPPLLAGGQRTIYHAAQVLSKDLENATSKVCRAILWLIIHRYLPVDLRHPIHPDQPVQFQ